MLLDLQQNAPRSLHQQTTGVEGSEVHLRELGRHLPKLTQLAGLIEVRFLLHLLSLVERVLHVRVQIFGHQHCTLFASVGLFGPILKTGRLHTLGKRLSSLLTHHRRSQVVVLPQLQDLLVDLQRYLLQLV